MRTLKAGLAGESPLARLRDRKGARFVAMPKCDGCGKPVTEHGTDDRICGGSDGPGFYICDRKRCGAALAKLEAEKGMDGLREHYTAQRAKNDAA